MNTDSFAMSLPGTADPLAEDSAFVRLWRGFMTGRVMIALVLLLLLGSLSALAPPPVSGWLLVLCAVHFAASVAMRAFGRPRLPGQTFDGQWLLTIGVDLALIAILQFSHAAGIGYVPLFALPLLQAAVLGSLTLALGTAAVTTLLLLFDAWQTAITGYGTARFLQAALTGTGFFIVALLANQLASRLAREETRARQSQRAARMQVQVNELVIESLPDGVLVVDEDGVVRTANPAAHRLLGAGGASRTTPFVLAAESAWAPLVHLAQRTFTDRQPQVGDIALLEADQGPRRIHVRTRLTTTSERDAESLCVMFLEDLREMEARLRTEKLAAMGRMSAAVAHEIRNPLAAITQANALLDEDLQNTSHRRLTQMVRQNAQRLAGIVEEILDLARAQQQGPLPSSVSVMLDPSVQAMCQEWRQQAACGERLSVATGAPQRRVRFEDDHLRRLLVNLLDNALRYASTQAGAIRVVTDASDSGAASLRVWSDGAPLEPSVQQHLFEPFFSSQSRSSGLGLYICRELCERHGALIGYQRTLLDGAEGNEFFVVFRRHDDPTPRQQPFDTIAS